MKKSPYSNGSNDSQGSNAKPDNYHVNAKICRLVERYPCMYDRSHIHYLKKDVVDKVWVKIAKEMDDSIPSCKERWRNIRTSFARSINVNKIPASANRTKPYYLHDELKFLASHITPGIPVSRRSNVVHSGDEKCEMIEVAVGEESFDSFAAMMQEQQQQQQQDEEQTQESMETCTNTPQEEVEAALAAAAVLNNLQNHHDPQQISSSGIVDVMTDEAFKMEQLQYNAQYQQLQMALAQQQKQQLKQSKPQQQMEQQSIEHHHHQQQQQQLQQSLPPIVPEQNNAIEAVEPAEIVLQITPPPKKRKHTTENVTSPISSTAIDTIERERERDVKPIHLPSETDFDAIFLQSLIPEMKAMDFHQKILFKRRVYEVIAEIFEICPSTSTKPATHIENGRTQTTPHLKNNSNTDNVNRPSRMSIDVHDLAMIRRLNNLLQSPMMTASPTSSNAILDASSPTLSPAATVMQTTPAAIISSSTRSTINTPITATDSVHRGVFTRLSAANLVRETMLNGSTPASSSTPTSPPPPPPPPVTAAVNNTFATPVVALTSLRSKRHLPVVNVKQEPQMLEENENDDDV